LVASVANPRLGDVDDETGVRTHLLEVFALLAALGSWLGR
jgi:hypothetical protein